MSELYNSIEKISNDAAPMVSDAVPMVGGAIKLSFIQKYYNFIKKYKFILFFFITGYNFSIWVKQIYLISLNFYTLISFP